MKLIPLVPRKPSVEIIRKGSINKLKKRPSALSLHSHSTQSQASSSRPGTPTSQNSDPQTPRQTNKLRKRSRSVLRSSPEPGQQSFQVQPLPSPTVQARAATLAKDRGQDKAPTSEVPLYKQTARAKLGPPPSPSHGRRFQGVGSPKSPKSPKMVFKTRPSQVNPPPPSPPRRTRPFAQDWELI